MLVTGHLVVGYPFLVLAQLLLGAKLMDMTSGFQGFHRDVVAKLLEHDFLSIGHFYQTEVRYLLRHRRMCEVPIHYKAPSPRVSHASVRNSLATLGRLFLLRLAGRAPLA